MKVLLYGKELKYSKSVETYLEIRKVFSQLYAYNAELPLESILNIKNVGTVEFFDVINQFHGKMLLLGLDKAVEILYSNGLEYANEEDFYETYEGVIDHFEEDLEPLIQQCCILEEKYQTDQQMQLLGQMSRSHWSGGGFGLGGAVKGAITAKALNIGMDFFRGIGDSDKEGRLSGDYKRKRDGILGSKNTYKLICRAIEVEFQRIAECVTEELVINEIIEPLEFEVSKAKALLKNTLRYKNSNSDELKDVIVECLQMAPFCKEIYDYLLEADGDNSEVIKFARHFQMMPGDMIEARLNTLLKMDESDMENILKKLEACRKWTNEAGEVLFEIECDLLKKLLDYCEKDETLSASILKRLEIFENTKRNYKSIGEIEAIRLWVEFTDNIEVDNRQIKSFLEDYIQIRKDYKIDIDKFVLRIIYYLETERTEEDISVQSVVEFLKKHWDKIVLSDDVLTGTSTELLLRLRYPATYVGEKGVNFHESDDFVFYLVEIEKLMGSAVRLWEASHQPEGANKRLTELIQQTAQYILKNNKYKVAVENKTAGTRKIEMIMLPEFYSNYLNQVLLYLEGRGENPFIYLEKNKLKKGEIKDNKESPGINYCDETAEADKEVSQNKTIQPENHKTEQYQNSDNKKSPSSYWALIFGILAMLTGCFCIGGCFGIVGIVCGKKAMKEKSRQHGMAMVGIVTSSLGILMSVILICAALFSDDSQTVSDTSAETTMVEAEIAKAETVNEMSEHITTSEGAVTNGEIETEGINVVPDNTDLSVWSPEYLVYCIQNLPMDLHNFKNEEEQINQKTTNLTPEQCYLDVSEGFWNRAVMTYKRVDKVTDYIYMGELKGDNPDGYGIIIKLSNIGTEYEPEIVQQIVYDGMFKEGKFSGFGKSFYSFTDINEVGHYEWFIKQSGNAQECVDNYFNEMLYMGYFKEGLYSGKGINIEYPSKKWTSEMTNRKSMKADEDANYYDLWIVSAEYKEGEMNGKVKVYGGGYLVYDGQMKQSQMDGKGTLYYNYSSNIKYEGYFSAGKMEGDGTLYDYGGSLICSGQWKNNLCGLINADDYIAPQKEYNVIEQETDQDLLVSESTETNTQTDYILPDSNTKYLTEKELQNFSKSDLRLGRNEIYARHGRKFETEDLKQYFSSQPWYSGYLSAEEFDDSVLNEYEKANLDLIKNVENGYTENNLPEYISGGQNQLGAVDVINSL